MQRMENQNDIRYIKSNTGSWKLPSKFRGKCFNLQFKFKLLIKYKGRIKTFSDM